MDFKALMNTSEYDFLQSLPEEIKKNIEGKVYPGLDPDSFFEELGIELDREKIDYDILLDELF